MFVDVILPLPLSDLFTYAVPKAMQQDVGAGHRVVVPFGKSKHYTGIVRRLHQEKPKGFEVKEIHSCIDTRPVVTEQQFALWEWISFYYLCSLGDVYKAALPPSMKPEDLQRALGPRTETYLYINPLLDEEERARRIGRAKKQGALLDALREYMTARGTDRVAKRTCLQLENGTSAVVKGLLDKEVVVAKEEEVQPTVNGTAGWQVRLPYPLNEAQQRAYEGIKACFKEQATCLLHGVTSSGKTEIYMHLMAEALSNGMQVLYLVPEIALTTQLTERLRLVFGDKMAVYHSRIKDRERVEIWQKMLSDEPYEVILGVRSSLFLPLKRPGLIIVDEEHESSYKQQDPAPRYHARDTAVMLGHITGAKTLLGSATPSIESFHNARKGKYGLVSLSERYSELMLPKVRLEDTRDLRRRKKMKSLLAPELIKLMEEALTEGEQVILFRNRRGFASLVECGRCGWIPKCHRCDVALTYHKRSHRMVCHYCNAQQVVPTACPKCANDALKPLGLGTERLEEEVTRLFPEATVGRLDADTTKDREAMESILTDFKEEKIQILVGTQMLSKGLDFDRVRVVGIIQADSLLNFPDFRSHERGFQLMVQAAGRSGRKHRRGSVVIQSNDPQQPIYQFITGNDYEGFYRSQVEEREAFRYPPFYRLIRVVFKHTDEMKAEAAATHFASLLRRHLEERVLGPNRPVVSRVQRHHIREILVKMENSYPIREVRDLLKRAEKELRRNPEHRYMTLFYDVDPL